MRCQFLYNKSTGSATNSCCAVQKAVQLLRPLSMQWLRVPHSANSRPGQCPASIPITILYHAKPYAQRPKLQQLICLQRIIQTLRSHRFFLCCSAWLLTDALPSDLQSFSYIIALPDGEPMPCTKKICQCIHFQDVHLLTDTHCNKLTDSSCMSHKCWTFPCIKMCTAYSPYVAPFTDHAIALPRKDGLRPRMHCTELIICNVWNLCVACPEHHHLIGRTD